MRKLVAWIVVAGLVGGLGWMIRARMVESGDEGGKRPKGGAAVAVELAPVETATVRDIALFTGSLQARSQIVVAPKVSGLLKSLTVDMGDEVVAGQLIAELEADEYEQQVEQARAELAVAEAGAAEAESAMHVATRELERIQTLHEKQVASASELDEAAALHAAASARHRVALAEITRREAALKGAEVRLSYTRIHAGWQDGEEARVVGERYVHEGDMLQANTPIVLVVDNRTMVAAIDVIERDYPNIRIGQQARLTTDGYPDREFVGTVVRIAPLLKELSRQARVEIELPNGDHLLKPGMFVRVRIEIGHREDATVVPVSALARRENSVGVFVAEEEQTRVRFVPLKLGIVEGGRAEVLEPALTGSVVTLGHHLLESGAPIRVPEARAGQKGPAR